VVRAREDDKHETLLKKETYIFGANKLLQVLERMQFGRGTKYTQTVCGIVLFISLSPSLSLALCMCSLLYWEYSYSISPRPLPYALQIFHPLNLFVFESESMCRTCYIWCAAS
jgi:hypothetical protein